MADQTCIWDNTANYNEPCSKQALLYSYIAFTRDLKSLYEWRCPLCQGAQPLHIVGMFDGRPGDHYGYIGYLLSSPETLILSFRGTKSFETAMQDSDIIFRRWPEHVPNSRVHHGFLSHYNLVRQRIREILTTWLITYPATKLVVTGHSLGAAAAMIASVDLNDLVPNPFIYTFGCPRVGNGFFAQHVKDLGLNVFRVVHDHDIVPHTPWCSLSLWNKPCPGGHFPTHPPTEVILHAQLPSQTTKLNSI